MPIDRRAMPRMAAPQPLRQRALVAVLALLSAGAAHAECGETGHSWSDCAWKTVTPSVFTDVHVSAGITSSQFGSASAGPLLVADSASDIASAAVDKTLQGIDRFNQPSPVDIRLRASAADVGSDDMLQLKSTATGVGTVTYPPNQPVSLSATWDGLYTNNTADRVSLSLLAAGNLTRELYSITHPVADRLSVLTVGSRSFVDRVNDVFPDYFPHLGITTLDAGESVRVSLSLQLTMDFADGQYYTGSNRSDAGNAYAGKLLSFMATPVAAVPEPETLAMFLVGMAGLGALRRRRAG